MQPDRTNLTANPTLPTARARPRPQMQAKTKVTNRERRTAAHRVIGRTTSPQQANRRANLPYREGHAPAQKERKNKGHVEASAARRPTDERQCGLTAAG